MEEYSVCSVVVVQCSRTTVSSIVLRVDGTIPGTLQYYMVWGWIYNHFLEGRRWISHWVLRYYRSNIYCVSYTERSSNVWRVRASPIPTGSAVISNWSKSLISPKPPSPVGPILAFWHAKRYERRQTEDYSFEKGVELISLASLDFTSLTNQIHPSTHLPTHWTPVLASFRILDKMHQHGHHLGWGQLLVTDAKGFPNFNWNGFWSHTWSAP
jgi:hypothetical protein